eukprot:TRINITY_DN3381_c0_g1_i1.p1 TRINITY_DN3381_c0_g1~~TRINITY_DN3381_c0_g1_i1.p1  ORF type:complete len:211 (-),score=87.46 TRINITY_DN3381_c0_g1_i1:136-768(-)
MMPLLALAVDAQLDYVLELGELFVHDQRRLAQLHNGAAQLVDVVPQRRNVALHGGKRRRQLCGRRCARQRRSQRHFALGHASLRLAWPTTLRTGRRRRRGAHTVVVVLQCRCVLLGRDVLCVLVLLERESHRFDCNVDVTVVGFLSCCTVTLSSSSSTLRRRPKHAICSSRMRDDTRNGAGAVVLVAGVVDTRGGGVGAAPFIIVNMLKG